MMRLSEFVENISRMLVSEDHELISLDGEHGIKEVKVLPGDIIRVQLDTGETYAILFSMLKTKEV